MLNAMHYNLHIVNASTRFLIATICIVATGLLAPEAAHAFRCKGKIVTDGLHEQQVVAICGAPTSSRQLGYTVRSLSYGWRRTGVGGLGRRYYPGLGHLSEEVIVTEFVYNFGPRKFMQRLLFEGGILVSIESIGYGYHEK